MRIAALRRLTAMVQTEILAPIYNQYPDMRGRDLTVATAQPNQRVGSASGSALPGQPKRMGFATALHLRWVLEELATTLRNASIGSPLHCKTDAMAQCGQPDLDIGVEFGVAASPIYAAYPDLWRLAMQHSAHSSPAPKRTAQSDAEFRKAKAAAGPLVITPAALAYLREANNEIVRNDVGCQVLTIFWVISEAAKGPEDKDWKSAPPGVMIGFYGCQFVPPDAVQIIDGIKVAVAGVETERFAGKTIDRENGKLVIRDR